MRKANSLGDLLRIRAANAQRLEAFNQSLGTALGYKTVNGKWTDEPCVIVFVPTKCSEASLSRDQRVPEFLHGPDDLYCPTDVVVGGRAETAVPIPELDAENQSVVKELRSGSLGILGGIQLWGYEGGDDFVGTAACLVTRASDGRKGLLTNQHVGGSGGRSIYHPERGGAQIGVTRRAVQAEPDEKYWGGLINEIDAQYRIDCAFIELSDEALDVARSGLHRLGSIGTPLPLDLQTMGPLGKKVISIGRTRGITRGTIIAFGYEWYDEDTSEYTDYLILGDGDQVFSDVGDSGKLIVTDDEQHQAIALLWGGRCETLRQDCGAETFTYAVDIHKALGRLGLSIDGAEPSS